MQIRMAIVDDHPAFRAGLRGFIERNPELVVVGECDDTSGGIDLATAQAIDVALINLLAPTIDGIRLIDELHARRPGCAIVGLSSSSDPCAIATMLRVGARGVVTKSQDCDEIARAIRIVCGGDRYLPGTVTASAVDAALTSLPMSLDTLTRREREVFELLVRGLRNEEIGARLFIARRTVETHRQRIFKKLSVHSMTQMIRIAALYTLRG
jgi:two-component system, NarL family, response regulator LiaR